MTVLAATLAVALASTSGCTPSQTTGPTDTQPAQESEIPSPTPPPDPGKQAAAEACDQYDSAEGTGSAASSEKPKNRRLRLEATKTAAIAAGYDQKWTDLQKAMFTAWKIGAVEAVLAVLSEDKKTYNRYQNAVITIDMECSKARL